MDLPSSSKNWDMPSFFPRMPMDIRREKRQQDHHSLRSGVADSRVADGAGSELRPADRGRGCRKDSVG
jgi:hypothetical protein